MTIDSFGPFALDRTRRRLSAHGRPVPLSDRELDVLLLLTGRPGTVFSKDALIEGAWSGVAVTDASLYAVVKHLRAALGVNPDGQSYIETLNRRGYRFVGPLPAPAAASAANGSPAPPGGGASDIAPCEDAGALDRLLEPHRAFIDGRAALERLDVTAVAQARETFARVLGQRPDLVIAHSGFATACVLQYEATRATASPDREVLAGAEHHARRACTLAPNSADAWSTLALVCSRVPPGQGESRDDRALKALAAAQRAVSLEPHEWRHHLRLAFVAGGAERLRAAHRVLDLRPRLGLAHWLAATVFVARQAYDAALDHVRAGCVAQDTRGGPDAAFATVGLHLLHGLLLARHDDLTAADAAFARELETTHPGHIYGREACATACYARGALHLRAGDRERAREAFADAIQHLPSHAFATALLGAMSHEPPTGDVSPADAVACAVRLSVGGRHAEAADVCAGALASSRSGPGAAWILPIEPVIHTAAHPAEWADVLTLLQQRAS